MPWVPVQGSWAAGTHQWTLGSGQQWAPQQQLNPTGDPNFASPGQRPEFIPGGMPSNPYANSYPNFPPGFVPLPFPNIASRPEPGDPLYTSPADSPEVKLITLQLAGQTITRHGQGTSARLSLQKTRTDSLMDPSLFRPTTACNATGGGATTWYELGSGIV